LELTPLFFFSIGTSSLAFVLRQTVSGNLLTVSWESDQSPSYLAVIVVQTLSSIGVIMVFPLQMTSVCHRLMVFFLGYRKTLDEHREGIAISEPDYFLSLLGVSRADKLATQTSTQGRSHKMSPWSASCRLIAFLFSTPVQLMPSYLPLVSGWLAILHYGPNSAVYPFFKFAAETSGGDADPYTFELTFWASSIIWVSHLASSLLTPETLSCLTRNCPGF
jgi:hypothetical protein